MREPTSSNRSKPRMDVAATIHSGSEQPASNRREGRRWGYKRQIIVCVQHPGGGVARLNVVAHDLSTRGLQFRHAGFLYPGSAVAVSLINREGVSEVLPGNVVRCSHVDRHTHEVAVKFTRKINIHPYVDLQQDVVTAGEGSGIEPASLRGRLLYIDDSPMDRLLLTSHLSRTSIECRTAATVSEGLLAYQAALFDIVMCDLNLGTEDGKELIREIRSAGFVGPVVVVSAEAPGPKLAQAKQSGAGYILHKPYEPKRLLDLMGELHMAAGAILDPEALHSTADDQPAMQPAIAQFVEFARTAAADLERKILNDDLNGVRSICLGLKGSAPGYGFGPLGEVAKNAVKAIDSTQSVVESRPQLRSLGLMCANVQPPRARGVA